MNNIEKYRFTQYTYFYTAIEKYYRKYKQSISKRVDPIFDGYTASTKSFSTIRHNWSTNLWLTYARNGFTKFE